MILKTTALILLVALLCPTIAAAPPGDDEHYMIVALVWDNETGQPEEGVAVTFGNTHTLYTAEGGSVAYNTANLPDIADGGSVDVYCKYGVKTASITYTTGGERNIGTAVTFNEPSEHYMIVALVWDNETGQPEEGVAVTFGNTHTLYTAEDGSVVYNTADLPNIADGGSVWVSCKYGIKTAPITYTTGGERNWGTAVTFNEPSELDAVTALAAMGLAATAIGGGRYLLRKRKKTKPTGDNMAEETTAKPLIETTPPPTEPAEAGSKLLRDFGVRALFGTVTLLGYIALTGTAVVMDRTDMIDNVTNWYMPLIMAIVGFYFGGSTALRTK